MQPPRDRPLSPSLASLAEGALTGLALHQAEERVTCVHAERCGGCPVIALPYGEQLALKRGRVVQAAGRYTALELAYTEPVIAADPIVGYRTRAKLIIATGGRIGLYGKGGGHHVIDIPDCRVIAPALADVAAAIRPMVIEDEATAGPFAPFDHEGKGALRAVDLREVRGDEGSRVLVTLVMQKDRAPERERLLARAEELVARAPAIAGVALNVHDGDSPQVLGAETVVLFGAAFAEDRLGKSRHHATYGSFVQAHRGQAERVHTTLSDMLALGSREAPPRLLDLYGGSGAIALALASMGADVHLVESFGPAAAHAEEAARSQGLSVQAEAADVTAAMRRLIDEGASFDAAIVNPPRRGMSPLARELLARLDVPAITYVSCDPDTLARDLDHFVRLGFSVVTLRPLDMIPLTDEVETVVHLRRVGIPAARVLYEDSEIVIVDKGAHEPTTPQSEYGSSLLARVRQLPQCEAAVPVHRHDVGTSGLVAFVRTPALLERWQAVFTRDDARKIYLAGVRGIAPIKGAVTRDLREDGKSYPARTRYRRLAVASGHSVLRVIPEQGRTHQARRHLSAIGHPILGDDRYGHPPTNRYFEEKNGLDRTFLHCVRFEFTHPDGGHRMIVECPFPGDLNAVLERTAGPGTLRFLAHKSALGHGGSSLPPAPDSRHVAGSILDIDGTSPSLHPEPVGDDEDIGARGGDD